jgi:hypothetical protein
MSVDKAKDTSPKKTITENKIVEAKPESSTKTENKPDATPKKQGMGEGQKPVSKAYKDNWNNIFGKKEKAIAPVVNCMGDLCSRDSFGVRWRCWERCQCSYQVGKSTFGPVIRSVRIPSSDGKMTSSVSAKSGSLRSAGSSDGLKSAGLIGGS